MENMKKLFQEMEKNPKLKAKIEELDQNKESVTEDYIQAAAEYGIELTAEDFRPENAQGEVSDDELDAVAGGDACSCVVGGGGSPGDYDCTCACVLGGAGDYNYEKSRESGVRCVCAMVGGGMPGSKW